MTIRKLNSKGIKGRQMELSPPLPSQIRKKAIDFEGNGTRRKEGTKTPLVKEPLMQRSLSKGLTSMTFQSLPIFKLLVILGEKIKKK
jgi:hypothetical protein